ncbi:GNAT family N-acetyltransferase [Corynebacterium mastitidis]|uniref:GNAT family N-acetyltransferase n=1 Tax=Corynebacterium mastitidis TaxID=161890 RepID=A0ABU8NXG6_9CORY
MAPEFRRRGYAAEILRQGLILLARRGVRRALLVCDDDNVGSARVIEANGGVLEDRRRHPGGGSLKRRYWIPLGKEAGEAPLTET